MNEQNLIPFDKRTESEQREIRKKGGVKSGQVRRARKTVRQTVLDLLYTETDDGGTILEEMFIGAMKRAIKTGDPGAIEKVLEYAGLSRKDKREEAELKLKQAQADRADRPDDTAADAWTDVLAQIRGVMEADEDPTDS